MKNLDSLFSRQCVYIVGGGPSLKGFNFNLLQGKHTIAVNSAIIDVPNPTYFLTADTSYAKKAIKQNFWGKITNRVLVTSPTHPNFARVKDYLMEYDIVLKFHQLYDIGFDWKSFGTGRNSGFCAMQFALLLGYKIIYLLGFDLVIQGSDHHYHNRHSTTQHALDSFLPNFIKGLQNIKLNTSVRVVSCSPISPLNSEIFYVSLEDALK